MKRKTLCQGRTNTKEIHTTGFSRCTLQNGTKSFSDSLRQDRTKILHKTLKLPRHHDVVQCDYKDLSQCQQGFLETDYVSTMETRVVFTDQLPVKREHQKRYTTKGCRSVDERYLKEVVGQGNKGSFGSPVDVRTSKVKLEFEELSPQYECSRGIGVLVTDLLRFIHHRIDEVTPHTFRGGEGSMGWSLRVLPVSATIPTHPLCATIPLRLSGSS